MPSERPVVSAIICTHNPRPDYLQLTLASLAAQRSPAEGTMEFILVDNESHSPLRDRVDLSPLTPAFTSARVVSEPVLGLTHARLRGFHEAKGAILVYIDDDNVLERHYLANAAAAFAADVNLGAAGGKSLPRYEAPPPDWFGQLGISLGCRDLGDEPLYADWSSGDRVYPGCAPIGAGMAIRRKSCAAWVDAVTRDTSRIGLGRRGADLASGEDNDMVLTLLGGGWRIAYLPQLSLEHLIPASRLSVSYLARYARSSNRTWVRVLDVHGIRPWAPVQGWTLPLRKTRSYVRNRPWRSPANYVRWKGACGTFEGQALLGRKSTAE
ncbi:MAG: glycosyltransferase [bacterium]|nr:glycosyltransferase [bacterium]